MGKPKAKDTQEDTQNQKADQRCRHNGFHFAILPGTEIAAHKHTCTNTSPQCHANENIGQSCTGTNRRQRRGTHKLTDDNGVSHIVYLLKKAAQNHRHCKNRQRFQRRIGNQILLF